MILFFQWQVQCECITNGSLHDFVLNQVTCDRKDICGGLIEQKFFIYSGISENHGWLIIQCGPEEQRMAQTDALHWPDEYVINMDKVCEIL